VPLEYSVGLKAAQAQCLTELVVRNPVLPVKLDEICLARLSVEIRPIRADLLLNLLRNLKADGHDTLPQGTQSAPECPIFSESRAFSRPNSDSNVPFQVGFRVIWPKVSPIGLDRIGFDFLVTTFISRKFDSRG
jgi:hypothetical protein